MTPLREAATMALEALEWFNRYGTEEHGPSLRGAEYAIRAALAQPVQETVMAEYKLQTYAAYKTPDGEMKIGVVPDDAPLTLNGVPLYPRREWVGLTDEEMHECWGDPLTPLGMKHARMIEAKLKGKNG